MAYGTSDNRQFDNEMDARAHQGYINKVSAEAEAYRAAIAARANATNDEVYSEVRDAFKSRNWDMVIKLDNNKSLIHHMQYGIAAKKILGIALAYKNDDYGKALDSYFRPWTDVDKDWVIETNEPTGELDEVYSAGKKAWERVHGREMTNADMKQAQIEFFERYMRETSEITNSYFVWFDVDRWERVTGKKMTKAEQTRIIGRPFPEDTRNYYKGTTSTSSSSSGNGSSIITKIIGAVIGAVICGMLLKFLPSFIAVIGGGVAGWFLGGALKKKFIVIGIIAVVVLLFGQRIVGVITDKFTGSKTSSEQTAEE